MNRSARKVAALLPRMWRAKAHHGEDIVNLIGTSLEVDYERPQRYTIDGDLYTSEHTQRFSVGPPSNSSSEPAMKLIDFDVTDTNKLRSFLQSDPVGDLYLLDLIDRGGPLRYSPLEWSPCPAIRNHRDQC